MPLDPNEPSFIEDDEDRNCYDQCIKDLPGWFPAFTAPTNRFVLALFVNHETKEHLVSFAMKMPAGLYGDEYKDEHWMSYNSLKGIKTPSLWSFTHLPEASQFPR